MNLLPKDFNIERYGLKVRLVDVQDADFIYKLRTDPILCRYIHSPVTSLEKQIDWIKSYKERENRGEDYYFIYEKSGVKIGVNRLYNIRGAVFTMGSWVFTPNAPLECSIASAIIVREIAFDMLNGLFENAYDGCHIDNVKVLRFNKMLGLKEYGRVIDEKGTYITMTLTRDDFNQNKVKLIKLLHLE